MGVYMYLCIKPFNNVLDQKIVFKTHIFSKNVLLSLLLFTEASSVSKVKSVYNN